MNYKDTSKEIYDALGGSSNIQAATHCMTRIRLNLVDEGKVEDDQVKKIPNVMGVVHQGGQYQIILGNDVAKYYKELVSLEGFGDSTQQKSTNDADKSNVFSKILGYISGSMGPIIPAIMGGGMIKAFLIVSVLLGWLNESGSTYQLLSIFGDAPFYFLPILIAFSAAQRLGVSPMLATAVCAVFIHPNFISLVASNDPMSIFGLPVTPFSYASSIIPALVMVWVMSYIEPVIEKLTPNSISSFLKPVIFILLSATIAIVVVGPLGSYAGQGLSTIIIWIFNRAGWLAVGLMGALMPLIIMTGMHWAFAPIFLAASMQNPDYLTMPAFLVANIAQGAVAVAVLFKSKNKELKQLSLGAALSALLGGVTEPTIYGISLKYKKPMIAAMIGGGLSGIYAGSTKVAAYAFGTQSFLGLPIYFNSENSSSIVNVVISVLISFFVTLILTWILFKDEKTEVLEDLNSDNDKKTNSVNEDPKTDIFKVFSPVDGELVSIETVNDEVFSKKLTGEGVGIIPSDGTIYSPISGKVLSVFPTKHALGLLSDDGVELLIHVGINTINLNGEFFESFVTEGSRIEVGTKLLEVDFGNIVEKGYDPVTLVVVTNTSNFTEVVTNDTGKVEAKTSTILHIF